LQLEGAQLEAQWEVPDISHLQDGKILVQLDLHPYTTARSGNSVHAQQCIGQESPEKCNSMSWRQAPADGRHHNRVTCHQDIPPSLHRTGLGMDCAHRGKRAFARDPSTSGESMDHIRLGIHDPQRDTSLPFVSRQACIPQGKHVGKPNPDKVRLSVVLWLVV
jgi:hypothetical protein